MSLPLTQPVAAPAMSSVEPVPRDSAPRQSASGTASIKPASLWRELADGSAGAGVRIGVSVALAPLVAGLACLVSWVLAAFVPRWAYNWGNGFAPREELVAAMLVLAPIPYIAGLIWIWTRTRYRLREFAKAGLYTLLLAVIVGVSCFAIDVSDTLHPSFEVLVAAVICLCGGVAILLWVQAARQFSRRRPLRDPADGMIDVRCPTCGYRMIGLHESRCPECGTSYTLDELLAKQQFMTSRGTDVAR